MVCAGQSAIAVLAPCCSLPPTCLLISFHSTDSLQANNIVYYSGLFRQNLIMISTCFSNVIFCCRVDCSSQSQCPLCLHSNKLSRAHQPINAPVSYPWIEHDIASIHTLLCLCPLVTNQLCWYTGETLVQRCPW